MTMTGILQLRSAACIFAALAMARPGFAQAPTPASSQKTTGMYRIAGTVVDAKTGFPLARARVTITEARNERNVQAAMSSEDGHFEFHAAVGKFSLQAFKRGYILSAYNQHEQFWTGIVTGAGIDIENLILRVTPAALVTGRILDENGDPVREASVTLYREDRFTGVSRILRFRTAQTDDQGVYEVPELDAGTYFVSAQAHPWYAVHPPSVREAIQVDPSLDVAYPVTYYGDVSEADQATPIPVRGGDRVQADIHLNPLPALHLLFHVADEGTRGMVPPDLERPAFDDTEGVPNRGVQQVQPGLYEITGIPAGRYLVRMPDSDGELQAPMAVDLSSSQELAGASGNSTGKVKFKIQVAGAATLPRNIQIGMRNRKGRVNSVQVDEKGEAEVADLLADKYLVVAGSPNEMYSVSRMASESGPIEGRTLNITSSASISVSVTLTRGSVRIDGFAKRSGKAAPGAMMVLAPKDPESNPDLFRRDQSDLDGSFSFFNVPPGSYNVVAIQDGWDLDWSKPAVLAHYSRHAVPLVVLPQAKGVQRLTSPVEVESR